MLYQLIVLYGKYQTDQNQNKIRKKSPEDYQSLGDCFYGKTPKTERSDWFIQSFYGKFFGSAKRGEKGSKYL